MGAPRLNLKVSKSDFETRISIVETQISLLDDVIVRYNEERSNLDQFIDGTDSNYQAMLDRIDVNVKAAGKARAALDKTRMELQDTVSKMEGMSTQVRDTIGAATETALEGVETYIKINSIL